MRRLGDMTPILRLLGRFDLDTGAGRSLTVSGARAQLLMARLAMARGTGVDRAVLSALFWADRAEPQARASLRQTIWTLRQELKALPDALVATGDLVRLDPAVLDCDVARFERLAAAKTQPDLEAALALYRGEFLEGFDLMALAPEAEFLPERHRLRDLGLKVAAELTGLHARAGAWDEVVRVARRGLAIDSFDEVLHVRLIDALQRLGRQREARDQDEAFRSLMKTELGITLARQTAPVPVRPSATPSLPTTGQAVPTAAPPRRNLLPFALGVAVMVAMLALGVGLWRQGTAPSAVSAESAAADRMPTRSLQAYDLFLRAETQRRAARDDAQLQAVMAIYRQATDLDPAFAEAHAGLALAAVTIAQRRFDALLPPDASRDQAYDAAGRALQRDPENAHALIVLSHLQAQDNALAMALLSAKRAVASRPDDPEARANLALLFSRSGQASAARTELTGLRQLDPKPRPDDMLIYGEIAFAEGRYDAAIADFVRAWPDLPKNQVLLAHLTAALAIQGQLAQAQTVLKDLRATWPEANLHQIYAHYTPLREARQNQRLLDGLRRAGLPVWSPGADPASTDRLTGAVLAALVGQVPGSERQYLRGDEVCRIEDGRSICGAIFHAPPGLRVDFVFLAPTEILFFSGPGK